MAKELQKNILTADVWKNALKKTAKILLVVILVGFYISGMIVVIFPRFSAKIYNFMGLSRAEEYSLERVYEKSKDNADLYNLIVFEQNQKNYEKELNYINLLMVSDDYDKFCENLDKSAIKAIEEKSMIAHMCNVNGYLASQKVKCMFNLGLGVETFIYTNLTAENNLIENSYASYVELVYDSNMSKAKKKEAIETLNETFEQSNNNLTIEDLFKERIADIIIAQTAEEDAAKKILLEYALMENYKAGELYNLIIENTVQAEVYEQLYLESVTSYYNLVK